MGFEAPHYQLDGPAPAWSAPSGVPRRVWPAEYQYPIEIATRSGLFGPWERARSRRRPAAGVNPGKIDQWGIDNFQIFPNLEILIWETGLVPHLPVLADVAQHAPLRGDAVLRAVARTPATVRPASARS